MTGSRRGPLGRAGGGAAGGPPRGGGRPPPGGGAPAAQGQLAQVNERGLARWQREAGEPVAEILEREAEAQRELARRRERVGQVAEALRHRLPAPEGALAVDGEASARVIEVGLLADAREDVGELPALRPGVERLVGRHQRHPHGAREPDQPLEHALLLPVEVTLDLDVAARASEDRAEPREARARAGRVAPGGAGGGGGGGRPRGGPRPRRAAP